MYSTFFRFFGLRENPFNVNPDPSYLFLPPRARNTLDDLASAVQARRGLMLLTGEVGTGKTTLINCLMNWLRQERTPTAFVFNPRLEAGELFDLIIANFGVRTESRPKTSGLARLNQWLVERYRMGVNAVLIVDEAQGLSLHTLEEIRILLNQETPHEKLLQIVLSGQSELEEKLKRFELRQVRQRISLRCQTMPLTLEEAHAYVLHRLRIAGGTDRVIFAPEAIDAVHFYSRGIPRVMNMLCEHALIRASLDQIEPVPLHVLHEVARHLQFDEIKPVAGPINILTAKKSNLIAADSNVFSALQQQEAEAPHLASVSRDLAWDRKVDEGTLSEGSEGTAVPAAMDQSQGDIEITQRDIRPISPKPSLTVDPIRQLYSDFSMGLGSVSPSLRTSGSKKKSSAAVSVMKRQKAWLDGLRLRRLGLGSGRGIMRDLRSFSIPSRMQSFCRECLRGRGLLFSALPAWHRNAKSLLRWLQEPFRPAKVRSGVTHKHV